MSAAEQRHSHSTGSYHRRAAAAQEESLTEANADFAIADLGNHSIHDLQHEAAPILNAAAIRVCSGVADLFQEIFQHVTARGHRHTISGHRKCVKSS